MILADILQWLLLVLGALITLNAHWLGAHALFPALVARARRKYVEAPVKVTLVGLAVAVPTLVVAIGVGKLVPNPAVTALAVGLGLIVGLLALVGSAGLVDRIGAGMPSPLDETQPWRGVMRGGIVLGCAFLMPFLGWFVLLPWVLVSGLGAWILAGRAPRVVRAAAEQPLDQAS